jgi:hypothetical protein
MDETCEELKKKLEKEGMEQLKVLQTKTSIIPPEKELVSIMQKGADEFKEKMGRNMTYSEMREMYG